MALSRLVNLRAVSRQPAHRQSMALAFASAAARRCGTTAARDTGSGAGSPAAAVFAAGALAGASSAGAYFLWLQPAKPSTLKTAAGGSQPFKRVLFVMRGPPGSGKSTLAREILAEHLASSGVSGSGVLANLAPLSRAFMFSTDDFFAGIDEATGKENYVFDVKKIGANHERNRAHCEIAMELGITPVLVDNTNVTLWEMRPYVELAKKHGYEVQIRDVFQISKDAMNLQVLKERCAARAKDAPGKEIPDAALERMLKRYERLPEDPFEAERLILLAERPPPPPPRPKPT